jgi:hypothetical protein
MFFRKILFICEYCWQMECDQTAIDLPTATSAVLHHHHQPIVFTAREQAFLMDHPQEERATTTRAQCGLEGANYCKHSRNQQLNVPSEGRRSTSYSIFGHPSDDRPMLLSFRDRTPSAVTVGLSSSSKT